MSQFHEVFQNKNTVLPVIHVESSNHVIRNTEIARSEAADGVFLISMKASTRALSDAYESVRKEYPDLWIGVNRYPLPAVRMFNGIEHNLSGIWADDARIDERKDDQVEARKISDAKNDSKWNGLYFGGVAFKYQRPVIDLEKAARIATSYMDVITTSGDKTGKAPEIRKIERMKNAIGSFPLAIASGISIDNVVDFKDIADCFIVSTSLLKPETEEFDPSRIHDFMQAVRG